ncbi:MAG: AI-2E family transporter, partial [Candidatus Binatia bacterium]
MTRQQLFAAFFFAAFVFLLFQLYSLFSAFLVPLTWTVILVLTFYPLYTVLLARLQGRRTLASLLLTLLVILLVAVPVFLLSGILAAEVLDFYQRIRAAAESGELRQTLSGWRETSLGRLWEQWGPRIEAFEIDLPELASEGAKRASQFIVGQVTGVARNLFVFLFDFLIISFSLFFLFRDGEESYRTIRDLIPMEPAHKEAIFHRLYETVSAVVQGMATTAVAQGLLAGLGFW